MMTGNGLTNAQVKNAGSQHTKVAFTGRGPVCRKLETASLRFGGEVARLTRPASASLCVLARTTGIDGGFMNRLAVGQAGCLTHFFVWRKRCARFISRFAQRLAGRALRDETMRCK